MTRRYAMLVKEKKPNEYTEGRRRRAYGDRHTPQGPSWQCRQGPGGGRAEGQAGSLGAAHTGNGQDGTGLGRNHTVRGAWHLRRQDQDQQTQAQGPRRRADARTAYELQLETGPSSDPFSLQHGGRISVGLLFPLSNLPVCRALGALG